MFTGWINFRTGETDYFDKAPEDFKDYIPQNEAAQTLYGLYVNHLERSPLEACKEVLEACVKEQQ